MSRAHALECSIAAFVAWPLYFVSLLWVCNRSVLPSPQCIRVAAGDSRGPCVSREWCIRNLTQAMSCSFLSSSSAVFYRPSNTGWRLPPSFEVPVTSACCCYSCFCFRRWWGLGEQAAGAVSLQMFLTSGETNRPRSYRRLQLAFV